MPDTKADSGRVMVDEKTAENHQRAWLGIEYLSQNALVLDGIRTTCLWVKKTNSKNQINALIKMETHLALERNN